MAEGGSLRYRTEYFSEILAAYENRGRMKEKASVIMQALMMDVSALITVLATGGGEEMMQEALSAIEGM